MLAFYDFPTQTNMPIRIGQRLGKQLSKSLFEDQSISFDSLYAFSHLAFFFRDWLQATFLTFILSIVPDARWYAKEGSTYKGE